VEKGGERTRGHGQPDSVDLQGQLATNQGRDEHITYGDSRTASLDVNLGKTGEVPKAGRALRRAGKGTEGF
jgi:hypothetical protein